MFGCYRRGEANDPDTYVAAVAGVLAHYQPDVIRNVTDPHGGLPGQKTATGWSGLPDVADVKVACDVEAGRLYRLKARQGSAPIEFRRTMRPAEAKATIFTPQGYPGYEAYKARHAAGHEPCYFENRVCKDGETRYGIWTPYSWVT